MQIMAYFHPLLVEDVLTYLPVKSLIRFKCLSKYWNAFISTPAFAKSHYNNTTQRPYRLNHSRRKLLVVDSDTIRTLEGDRVFQNDISNDDFAVVDPGFPLFKILVGLASCRGLICAYVTLDDIYIWNPTTRCHRKLPISEFSLSSTVASFGFGYDHSTDDYKFVRLYFNPHNKVPVPEIPIMIEVFSLKTNKWKIIHHRDNQDWVFYLPYGHGNYCNGALHWLVDRSVPGLLENQTITTIMAFDLATEKCYEVVQPSFHSQNLIEVRVLEERLCALVWVKGEGMELWAMKEYNVKESWTELGIVPWVLGKRFCNLLCQSETGEPLMCQIADGGVGLVTYSFRDRTSRRIYSTESWNFLAVIHVESLISP